LTSAAPCAAAGSPPGFVALYRRLWVHAKGARARYLAAMVLLAGSIAVKLTIPWLAAQAINAIQVEGAAALSSAAGYVAAIFAVYVAAWAMHGPGRILERRVALLVRGRFADALYGKLASLPLAWHEQHHSGELQQRASQASQALASFTETQFVYVQNFVNVAGPVVALWLVAPSLGVVALVGYVLIAAVIVRFDSALARLAAQENHAVRRYAAMLLDFLGNISTLWSLRLRPASRKLLDARMNDVFVPLRRSIWLNEGKWCAVDLLSAALTWSLVAAFAWMSRTESASAGVPVLLGGIFMVYQYAQQAGGVIGSLASNVQGFLRMRTDFASASPIEDAAVPASTGNAVSEAWHTIDATGLTHAHLRADGKLAGVFDVSLTLHRGQRIALIGPSGSGKSTLLGVLAGLRDAHHGYYRVDGAVAFGVRGLASVSTLIAQEAEVFESSLRDNLTFGAAAAQADIESAVRVSALDGVVAALPQSYETPLAERGANLSGGQRQRLSIARGLLAAASDGDRYASLLLLDEPTSALDPLTEARVLRQLSDAYPDACIVASIHRLSALSHFDTVFYMDEGRLVDQGSYDEVLARQPGLRALAAQDLRAEAG
jgi:ABC-type multidrug transport system fused ATPase/permease subunit